MDTKKDPDTQKDVVFSCLVGVDPVSGTLVYQDAEEIVIRREDERAGVVHVHFPRYGFRISPEK